jgi:aminopeptidase YwaD
MLPPAIAQAVHDDPSLWPDFTAICDCGGRVSGTDSERRALALLHERGAAATGRSPTVLAAPYDGWTLRDASLHLAAGGGRTLLPCQALLRSAAGRVEAEVLPLGRGTPEDFAAAGDAVRGRIALVRHEYMFSTTHVHRRVKLAEAVARGAVGFLIAGPVDDTAVAGGATAEIPALGISGDAAEMLSPSGGLARVAIEVDAAHHDATTETVLFDLPGGGPGWVVLSAHIDGHAPAESAIDNATGVAGALAVARALAPRMAETRRGLRLAFFSAEEWALTGSKVWLAGLSPDERAAIVLNVNLDSIAGAPALTALISGFPALDGFVQAVGMECGARMGVHLPLMTNSDHANFAAHGIPALRLVAGFDDPGSDVRFVLTSEDGRHRVRQADLRRATLAAAALTWTALTADDASLAALRQR